MLTQLSTVKARLSIAETGTTNDAILTAAIKAISARFDKECRRTLSRTVNATFEFPAAYTEISVPCYPIETLTTFELKSSETVGWQEQAGCEYLILRNSVISLRHPIGPSADLARVTYTGGYVLPGTAAAPGQTQLPDDLEQAAVDQVAFWFQKRDHLGLRIYWPSGVAYQQFVAQDLLENVSATLTHYRRYAL